MAIRITRSGLGLTVGIIVLALVVLGGLYLVKERGEQARREESLKVAQQNLEAQSQDGTTAPSTDGNTENSGTPAEESTDGQEAVGDNGEVSVQENSSSEAANGEAAPVELPQTGPNDAAALVAIGALTFAGASYIASRRALL